MTQQPNLSNIKFPWAHSNDELLRLMEQLMSVCQCCTSAFTLQTVRRVEQVLSVGLVLAMHERAMRIQAAREVRNAQSPSPANQPEG